MNEEDELNRTIIAIALEEDVELTDNVEKLAAAVEKRKKKTVWYRIKSKVSENAPRFVLAIIIFIGTTVGAIITALVKGLE